MPSSQGHHDNQRRTFRGKGGATDGRLPPKKNRRVKVKYIPAQSAVDGVDGTAHPDIASCIEELDNDSDLDRDVDQLEIDNDHADISVVDDVITEINHLRKRVSNIQISLQASRGLSNPKIWHTNCLLPVKNAVKEWRSICKYHFSGNLERTTEKDDTHDVHLTDDCPVYEDILHETSVQVFSLLQMAMQSGPMVGSNPGYFKRCGGEVASIALEFLNEIVDLAGINESDSRDLIDANVVEELTSNELNHEIDGYQPLHDGDHGCEAIDIHDDESDVGKDVEINSTFSYGSDRSSCSDSCHNSASIDNHDDYNVILGKPLLLNHDDKLQPVQSQAIEALQTKLLFSVIQSQRICLWIKNAQKAVETNKAPSNSAKKLQSQKSKKQRSKELKMERKLKKKKRGGGK